MAKEQKSYISEKPSIIETTTVNEQTGESALTRTYHWQTPDNQSIFLYLTFSLKQRADGNSYFLVATNVDSSQVRGQGKYLSEFANKELVRLASEGLRPELPLIPFLVQANPNQYSLHLVANDKRFIKKGDSYYWLINP